MLYPFDFILTQKIFDVTCLILPLHHDLWARPNPQDASSRFMAFPQQGMGSSCLGREGFWDSVGTPCIPRKLGSDSLSLWQGFGVEEGARRPQEGDGSWGLAQNTDLVPCFFQDWTILSRFGRIDRMPVFDEQLRST